MSLKWYRVFGGLVRFDVLAALVMLISVTLLHFGQSTGRIAGAKETDWYKVLREE
jgi:hypothetical protein